MKLGDLLRQRMLEFEGLQHIQRKQKRVNSRPPRRRSRIRAAATLRSSELHLHV